jgi:predicted Rossmann-fold nucleotide-binding protein
MVEGRAEMKTQRRRAIVGVIGGEGQFETSAALGRSIIRRGWILLTGGQVVPRALAQQTGEVKESAMLGAAEEASGHPRLIGILPSSLIRWDYTPGSRRLFLHTGQPHYVRNIINGRTPDAVVAFGGSRGTLAEIAFAKASGKPLFFAKDSISLLSQKLREHFGDSRALEKKPEDIL